MPAIGTVLSNTVYHKFMIMQFVPLYNIFVGYLHISGVGTVGAPGPTINNAIFKNNYVVTYLVLKSWLLIIISDNVLQGLGS